MMSDTAQYRVLTVAGRTGRVIQKRDVTVLILGRGSDRGHGRCVRAAAAVPAVPIRSSSNRWAAAAAARVSGRRCRCRCLLVRVREVVGEAGAGLVLCAAYCVRYESSLVTVCRRYNYILDMERNEEW